MSGGLFCVVAIGIDSCLVLKRDTVSGELGMTSRLLCSLGKRVFSVGIGMWCVVHFSSGVID